MMNTSSNNAVIYNRWKLYASRAEIELYKKGQNGSDEISVVPFPSHLPLGNLAQVVGWATTGFTPNASEGIWIGDDGYSRCFDGSRGTLYNNGQLIFLPPNVRWKKNDVCGCGIEINGENTRIKYWLNGKLLGTAFAHQENIASTTGKCNLLPNGPNTTFFPGVTVESYMEEEDFPEDMTECPLPDGYTAILKPKLNPNTDSLVSYPYSAYLVGDDVQDFIYAPRNQPSATFLRDFINGHHTETSLNIHDH
ncbi:unnamed protein product [Rotaria socialis]|uniref:SPRY domain-containing protein n=1 Tax=Rotaria socialis TaxID=392032 RepID=A0A818BV97_9BILA|nr:unnamed protein product [Rotaria socialis]